MAPEIKTIFFDVGNTLRVVVKDQAFIDQAEAGLMELIQTKESHDELFAKLEERWKKYRKLSKTTLLDASEGELWTQYMLPDYEPNMIFANAARLTRLWRDHDGRRVARPDAVATLKELCARGYTLGIIANTVTETEIPDWMAADGVAPVLQDHHPVLQGPPAQARSRHLSSGLPLHRHPGGQLRLRRRQPGAGRGRHPGRRLRHDDPH